MEGAMDRHKVHDMWQYSEEIKCYQRKFSLLASGHKSLGYNIYGKQDAYEGAVPDVN